MFWRLCTSVLVAGALCVVPLSAHGQKTKLSSKSAFSPKTVASDRCAGHLASFDYSDWAASPCCVDDSACGWLQERLDAVGYGSWLSDHGFRVRGWVDQGITFNAENPSNNANFPVTFNDRDREYQLNQLYLIVERPVATCGCGWDLGGRVDLLYGTDYYFTTATGLEVNSDGTQRWNASGPRGAGPATAALYGLAMPQLYAEVFAPLGGGLNVKLGHFYSPLGYERVMAPANFFYSHSYALQYGEPLTLTGAIASYQLRDNIQLILGGTLGWNSWDSSRDQWGVLAGVSWTGRNDRTSLRWTIHTGEDGPPGLNSPGFFPGADSSNNATISSFVLTRWVTDRLQYVFQQDAGVEQEGAVRGGTLQSAYWYGINQYLLYCLNERWQAGLRFEWFRDEDHSRILDLATTGIPVSGSNYYALTAGLNWTPWRNAVIRPEIRWDWSDTESPVFGVGGPFDVFSKDSQLTLAVDAIVRF